MKTSYTQKKVLVTGGAGFIGSHIVDALVAQDAQVVVLDNLVTGSLDNIKQVRNKITFIQGDITDAALCKKVMQSCSYVFHLAACVSVPQSFTETELCHAVNITGTFNLLEAARKHMPEAFIFTSSCAVYGQRDVACSEAMEPLPTSPYAYSKWMGELYCQQYSRLFDVPTLALRYFNVFGERQNPFGPYAGVVAKFNQCLQQNLPVTIFGDGLQSRDFVPVAQVVAVNLKAALLPRSVLNGQPVNCASGTQTTVLDVLNHSKQQHPGYQHVPEFKPERVGDIRHSRADCTKLHTFFG